VNVSGVFEEIRPLLAPNRLLADTTGDASNLLRLAAGLLVLGLLIAICLRLRLVSRPSVASIPASTIIASLFLWALDGTAWTLFSFEFLHGFTLGKYWQHLVLLSVVLVVFLAASSLVHYVCPESHRGRFPVMGLLAAIGVVYADSLFFLLLVTPWSQAQ